MIMPEIGEWIDSQKTNCFLPRNIPGVKRQYHKLSSPNGKAIRVELPPASIALGRSYCFIIGKGTRMKIYTSSGILLTECTSSDLSCYEFLLSDGGEWECECNEIADANRELQEGEEEALRFDVD